MPRMLAQCFVIRKMLCFLTGNIYRLAIMDALLLLLFQAPPFIGQKDKLNRLMPSFLFFALRRNWILNWKLLSSLAQRQNWVLILPRKNRRKIFSVWFCLT